MKRTILFSTLFIFALSSCKKEVNEQVNRSVNQSYLVNMAPFSSSQLDDNSTRNVFDVNLENLVKTDLDAAGYNLDDWEIANPTTSINLIRFTQSSSSGLGDAIDSVKISISRDNFISKTLLISEKLLPDVNPSSGSTYSFLASQFLKTDLGDLTNSKIEIIMIPKSGTANAHDFNADLKLDYNLLLKGK